MKKFYLLLICSVFSIVILFPGNHAKCQYYSQVNFTEGDSPPIPQLYASEQNIDDTKAIFGSVTSAGNTLYMPVIKTLVPADSTPLSPDTASQSTERDYVIRAIDFSDPHNPALIKDMEIGIDIDRYPQLFLSISNNYIYKFNGEMDIWEDDSLEDSTFEVTSVEEANFTIFEIQDNHDIIKIKDLPLTNILDTIRGDQDGLLQAQLLTVTDDRAYLIFCSFGPDDPMSFSYNPYASEVLPGSYPTVEIDDYSDEGYVPMDASYSYTPWKPENNTFIVTIDITDPSNATILGASRPNIASTGANAAMEISGDIGYFVVAPLDSKDTSLYVVDLSSAENTTILNTLTLYGQGGQMARQGNYLYIAAKDFGLEIVDISDLLNPALIGWLETPHPLTGMYGSAMGGERNIVVKNDYVYMIERDGLLIIDVSDSGKPQLTGRYLSEYITDSSEHWFYAPYTSVDNAGDYLFLREMGAIDIVSIENPENPVSIGIFGVREAGIVTLALRLESAGLVEITTEKTPGGEIALFGIPSLDTLSRKYGVREIIKAGEYQKYYMPYMSYPPDESEPSVDDIKKDRDLRTYYASFPASVNQDDILADYLKNPYVITAELGMPEVYGPYGYSGGPYYPVPESGPSLYGGGPYGVSLYGDGLYGGGMYGGLYSGGGLYGSGVYGGIYGSIYGGSYSGQLYGGGYYGGSPISRYYGVGGLGMTAGLATPYPVSTSYPAPYPGPGIYGGYGLYGGYGGLMPPLSASAPMPEPTVHIGEINIEGGVHIGTLTINSEPSSTTPGLSIMIIPDIEPPRDAATYTSDDTTSSADTGLPSKEYSLGDLWTGYQDKSPSLWWNNLPLSSSSPITPNSWIWQ